MRHLPLILSFAMLAACGSNSSDDASVDSIEQDADGAQITVHNANGETAVIDTGANASANLPDGFTLYPGSTVVSNSHIATNDGSGTVLAMTTSDAPDKVAAYYKQQAQAAGISIAVESTANDTAMIAGEGDGGRSFTMSASKTDDGTMISLMVGQNAAE